MAAMWRLSRSSLVTASVRAVLCQGASDCQTAYRLSRGAKTWTQGSLQLQALIRWNTENKRLFGPVLNAKSSKKKSKKKAKVSPEPRLLEEKIVSGSDADAVDIVEVGQSEQEVFSALPYEEAAVDSLQFVTGGNATPRHSYSSTYTPSDDPFSSDSSEPNTDIPAMVPPPFVPSEVTVKSERSKISGYNPVTAIPEPKFRTTPSPFPRAPPAQGGLPKLGNSAPLPEFPELSALLDWPLFSAGPEWQEKLEPYTEFVSKLCVRSPTVNQVLSKTQSDLNRFFLQRWREKMIAEHGEEGFKLIHEETLRNGILLHHLIQKYLGGSSIEELQMHSANEGHWHSVGRVLGDISQVQALETPVCHPRLQYRGTLDCVAAYRGKMYVIDWKTSKKPKPELSNTYDNPLQVVAYLGAMNSSDQPELLGVEGSAIVVVYPDGSPAHVHTLDRDLCQQHWRQWLQRLKQYWQTVAVERGIQPQA